MRYRADLRHILKFYCAISHDLEGHSLLRPAELFRTFFGAVELAIPTSTVGVGPQGRGTKRLVFL